MSIYNYPLNKPYTTIPNFVINSRTNVNIISGFYPSDKPFAIPFDDYLKVFNEQQRYINRPHITVIMKYEEEVMYEGIVGLPIKETDEKTDA